ncbi:MAG TPA: hypothetical protein VEX86_08360 [Longimicrobium sp.]|nr:hypothetical protein [Longimicrobium sp.]
MTRRFPAPAAAALACLAALAACRGDDPGAPRRVAGDSAAVSPAPPPAWRANPAAGPTLGGTADSVVIETGPHSIAWPTGEHELAPPYTIRATFDKKRGRLHEGYGVIFGGSGLEGPEQGQVYSYFLVRGDGSFLVKRRQGGETPVVRDWTQHPAIRRDVDETGGPNRLEVAVSDTVAVFRVNGTEVARVPSAELSVRGLAGVRTAHECLLVVRGFGAEPGAADGGER